jgi:hypothetical protein
MSENNDLCTKRGKNMNNNGFMGGVYFMTIVGAAIYFIQHSTSFWGGVLGLLKALIWPLLVIYKALELLKM